MDADTKGFVININFVFVDNILHKFIFNLLALKC